MATGTVKWFNEQKGYGFISPDEGDVDIYFARASIELETHTLIEGQRVEFDLVEGMRGPEAQNIHIA